MAFVITPNTHRPKVATLLRRVLLIFWVPLIVLAVVPIVITTIAQLPPVGQLVFAFFGGAVASLPIVTWRLRRRRPSNLSGIGTIIILGAFLGALFPVFDRFMRGVFAVGVQEMALSVACGAAIFLGSCEIGCHVDRALKKWHDRLRGGTARAHEKEPPITKG
jgi:hypothetical protein